ncbi:conserved hypothetical protein [Desulfamplus magnetovallimortis]|uniref:Flagellar Assembly Protein A N-terminal region domain-containing protein n=1 Tax=Desulfamplus magnetovallimortis TaxID=1246637 RepID=A0A1W1HJ22_9BACT|nr:FapA family protein [Desulfamplus magnetovallimortis]SLM32501.1 conserved hypothetical protein [Desulfamplus magnetovallimortis]
MITENINEYDILLARIALGQNLVTKKLLARAFSFQQREATAGKKIPLGEIFLEKGVISPEKLDDLHSALTQRLTKKSGFSDQQLHSGKLDYASDTEHQRSPTEAPFHLMVTPDKLEARIQLKKGFSEKITPDDIIDFLHHNGITYGIADIEEISQYLETLNKTRLITIARGKSPLPGCDASMVYHFDVDHLKAGTVSENGAIDYRERGSAPRVQTGDLLATKLPMQNSEPGIDVYGKSIPAPEVTDIPFKCGEGTRLSEDGLMLYATLDGQPNLAVGGMISVYAELVINGDVNFNTGNIKFDGNVIVNGSIMNGFAVTCGNLTAKEIMGGKIVALGDVTIPGGIISADVKSEGNITAKFITGSNIKSFGNVIVEKEVINSKIRSSGIFKTDRGKIISSFISAKMGFESKEVGTDVSPPCRIHVGMDENVKKRIQAFNYAIDDKKKVLEKTQKRYEKQAAAQVAIHQKISELAQRQDRMMSERRSLEQKLAELKRDGVMDGRGRIGVKLLELKTRNETTEQEKNNCFKNQELLDEKIAQDLITIETLVKEIEKISEEKDAIIKWSIEEKGVPVIKVKCPIWQGTNLFGIHSSLMLTETVRNVTIKEVKSNDAELWRLTILESK